MAVSIRFRRMGSRKRPFYRLVATDSRSRRDGPFVEILGYYDPLRKPFYFEVDEGKVFTWLMRGAKVSDTAGSLLDRAGVMEKWKSFKSGSVDEATLMASAVKVSAGAEASDMTTRVVPPVAKAKAHEEAKPAMETRAGVGGQPGIESEGEATTSEGEPSAGTEQE